MNPHSSANSIPIDRPGIKVPRQKPFTPAIGLVFASANVAITAAPSTVIASNSIQSFETERVFRVLAPVAPVVDSGLVSVDRLCKKFDIAICVPKPQRLTCERQLGGGQISASRAMEIAFATVCK